MHASQALQCSKSGMSHFDFLSSMLLLWFLTFFISQVIVSVHCASRDADEEEQSS
jgi:hypothetical protein